jgi:hypothetical protein
VVQVNSRQAASHASSVKLAAYPMVQPVSSVKLESKSRRQRELHALVVSEAKLNYLLLKWLAQLAQRDTLPTTLALFV